MNRKSITEKAKKLIINNKALTVGALTAFTAGALLHGFE